MARKKKQVVTPKDKDFVGSFSVISTLNGRTKREVQKKADAYFGSYHPMGYSTHYFKPIQKHQDGYWFCEIRRARSCD